MASDLQFTTSDTIKWKGKTKIYKFKAHPDTYMDSDFMIGFAGSANDLICLAEFFTMPEMFKGPPRCAPQLQGLVLTEKGEIFTFNHPAKWLRMMEPFASIGSGSPFALGAMRMGSSPKEAVKAASTYDPYTGMGIRVESWTSK